LVQGAGQPNHTTHKSPDLRRVLVVALREIDCFLQDILLTWNSILEAKNFHAFSIFLVRIFSH
jgi:hypothetical protein